MFQCSPSAYGQVVGKAMHRLNAQLVWAEMPEHHPAACGAKIDSCHPPAGHLVPFDRRCPELVEGLRTAPVEVRSLT